MKYKVGDLVKIVSKRTNHFNGDGKMDCRLGRVMTIESNSNPTRLPYKMKEDLRWVWDDDMIDRLATNVDVLQEHIERMKLKEATLSDKKNIGEDRTTNLHFD